MKKENVSFLTKGIFKENPILRLSIGLCPVLAVTTTALNGVAIGVTTALVLVLSNFVISLLRKFIPEKTKVLTHITIIAGFVTAAEILIGTFLPAIHSSLGVYLPLIVVNCIILGRDENFASKNAVIPSVLDGIGIGIGFVITTTVMGIIRELIGAGTFFSLPVTKGMISPMMVAVLPSGAFFVLGVLIVVFNKLLYLVKKRHNENNIGGNGQ